MPGYLAVTDDRELTTAGKEVLAKTFVSRGEYTTTASPLPTYAGGRVGEWISPIYKGGAPAIARIRGGIAASRYTEIDYEILCLGDSKTQGVGADTGQQHIQSWPGVLARALGAVEGFITAKLSTEDYRWTTTNMQRGGSNINGLITTSSGSPSVATLNYTEPHTGGSFLMMNFGSPGTAGSITISVDEGEPQNLVIPAGTEFQTVKPTVSGDGPHNYKIIGGGMVRLLGFKPSYSKPKLKITNAGRSGSTISNWVPATVNGVGLWAGYRTAVNNPDAIICELGTNSPNETTQISTLWDAIYGVTKNSIVVSPGGIGGSGLALPPSTYAAMYLAVWDQADRLDLPLVDFASIIGNHDKANELGLKSDAVHENKYGYAYEAATIINLLGVK